MANLLELIENHMLSDPDAVMEGSRMVTYLNPFSYLLLRRLPDLMGDFHFIADSIMMAKILAISGIADCQRLSPDMAGMFPTLFSVAQKENYGIYVIGAREDQVSECVSNILRRYPSLKISGSRDGFFRDDGERAAAMKAIEDSGARFVLAGMGTPQQERFLSDLRACWPGTGIACGAFIHQTSKRMDYYPRWVNAFHLRWALRILEEPRKVLTRLFWHYTQFLLFFALDYYEFKKRKRISASRKG